MNPAFLMPSALATRASSMADDFVNSSMAGAGQIRTSPRIVVAIEGPALDAFCAQESKLSTTKESPTMLTQSNRAAYCRGVEWLSQLPAVMRLARGRTPNGSYDGQPMLFRTNARGFFNEPLMTEEIFGPASLIVGCRDTDELYLFARRLSGQLTATLHMAEPDYQLARRLLPLFERKAGRIVVKEFPTSIGLGYAMVHGGPFPATSDCRFTSVGASALSRFLRPICYQNMPDVLLPDALKAGNPLD